MINMFKNCNRKSIQHIRIYGNIIDGISGKESQEKARNQKQ